MKVFAGIAAFIVAYLVTGWMLAGIVWLSGGQVTGIGAVLLVIGWVVSGMLMTRWFYRKINRR